MNIEVLPVPGAGAEDVVVAGYGPDEGSVFTGTENGAIWRISHDGKRIDMVGDTSGRPLGIEMDLDGRLLVCDAQQGVLHLDPRTGAIEPVVDCVAGVPMMFCNNAAVASDGSVWFSDSSTRHGLDRWRDEFVQDTRTGRLLRLTEGGEVEVVLEGLAFANGVALAADESYVAVAESAARTVVRRWLTGPRTGERDFLACDLPGYPDNIARGSDGLIWVSIASPRDPLVERIQRGPMLLRKSVTMVPMALQPKPKRTVRAQAFDDEGRLVHDIECPADRYHMVTGVREHDGRLWLGSLHEPAVARVTL
ncbi:MAG: SMP-30/gluconolactonase/LRE family protein [Nocardioides sp.]|nr:SMP-30/gluconolactonase/LRE family protein [Nocardioides sp.]